jgi:hypothetical protein
VNRGVFLFKDVPRTRIELGAEMQGGDVTYPASVKGDWKIIHSNLSSTAETAAVLKRPATYAGAGVIPAKVHPATTRHFTIN